MNVIGSGYRLSVECLIILIGFVLFPLPTNAVNIGGETIGGDADFTYASEYLWHGYPI